MFKIRTTQGNTYTTDETGAVVSRSNGPVGWDYRGRWVILGVAKRAHSGTVNSLAAVAADPTLLGQGWVHDIDHGTRRMWGMERAVSIKQVMSGAEAKTYQAKDQNGDVLYESDSWGLVVTYLNDWLRNADESLGGAGIWNTATESWDFIFMSGDDD